MLENKTVGTLCDAFDAEWQKVLPNIDGDSPNLPDIKIYVEQVDKSEQPLLLKELLLVDVEYRNSKQLGLGLDDYKSSFPDLVDVVESAYAEAQSKVQALSDGTVPFAGKVFNTETPMIGKPGEIQLPREFGRYLIQGLLGQGGMGAVFLAHDKDLERNVALKVPNPVDMQDDRFAKRFQQEAKIAAGFEHPGLCQVLDVGKHDGVDFFTMPHIVGENLATRMRTRSGLSFRESATLVQKLAKAMQVAHDKNVIHRDIKPSNILLRPSGDPVVLDFGLARATLKNNDLTQSGMMMGTLTYMAPEQFEDAKSVGPQADVYSLGAVFYHLLSGQPPHVGKTHEVIEQLGKVAVAPLQVQVVDLDSELAEICERALATDVGSRTQSMQQFAQQLDDWLANSPQGTGMETTDEPSNPGLLTPSSSSTHNDPGPVAHQLPEARSKTKPHGDPMQQTVAEDLAPLPVGVLSSDSVDSAEQDALPANTPKLIGRYEVKQVLGQGAYGVVYLAWDPLLTRNVAIKVPHKERMQAPGAIETFLKEGQSLAKLKHKNILEVFDVSASETDHTCFVVSEYVPNSEDLEIRCQREYPSHVESARLIAEIADGLNHAHLQKIVHRDIKPANILLTIDDHPYLVDFGLALREQDQAQMVSRIAGTPTYMSPEQARGEVDLLDGRSDIWNLGAVLYELLSKQRPFISESIPGLMREIVSGDPKPPRQIDETVPAALEQICLKCLAKNPTDRYATASDVARDLRRAITPRSTNKIIGLAVAVLAGILIVAYLAGAFSSGVTGTAVTTAEVNALAVKKFQEMMKLRDAQVAAAPLVQDQNLGLAIEFNEIAWPESLKDLGKQIEEAIEKKDDDKEFSLLLKASNSLNELGQYSSAEAVSARMVKISGQDISRLPISFSQLGLVQYRNQRGFSAVENFKRAISIYEGLLSRLKQAPNNPQITKMLSHLAKMQGTDFMRLGNAYKSIGKDEEAKMAYEKAKTLCEEYGRKSLLSTVLGNYANLVSHSGDFEKAIELHQLAAKIAKELGEPIPESELLTKIGSAYDRAGKSKEARKCYREAYEKLTPDASYDLRTTLLLHSTSIHLDAKEFGLAKKRFEELKATVNAEDKQFEQFIEALARVFEPEEK
jgi:serine/threonine protein kinase/tetratricopeptide (TPR) repeat protein